MRQSGELTLQFAAVSRKRWSDMEALFGERGACGGCWCMTWRVSRAQFNRQKGNGNKAAMRRIVKSNAMPGILAYLNGKPVAWCAVAPRQVYVALERSRILKPVDDQPVWAISCLFVAKSFRRQSISSQLIRAATEFAASRGAKIVESYPQTLDHDLPDAFVWTGLEGAFLKAGFSEVARRSPKRPIMRFVIPPHSKCSTNIRTD
jgi:GNAT superfamily N-acetyltransferase